ncbi:MATE family efflux transporter [Paenibacillus popilliae]|uniref:Probable multidrug resistance protein NorM n=1 Tax=Paenibacillus popilliae ATCC 14706 TaxID=1212764 RepID=M9LHX0_PAEPP|nr:MATE family efflux transporter [Paenibacillus popilliae]GAC42545.1 Na+-driven multidrug efflux pump [Paenibacillus popilliae ATCC 14706]
MKQTFTLQQKIVQMLHIFLPIFVTQVAMQLMSFFDTVMSGNYSATQLAGVAIGGSIWAPVYTGISGIFLAVTPIIAHHMGAGRKGEVSPSVTQAAYLSVIVGAVVVLIGAFALDPVLAAMRLEVEVHRVAKDYLIALGFGVIPAFLYTVFRASMDGLGQTRVTMFITLLSFPVNVTLNYFFIFGKCGFPEMGGVGAGIATAITYLLIAVVAFLFMRGHAMMQSMGMLRQWEGISFSRWNEILRIGTPIGLSIFFEVSIFAAVTLFMSEYDTNTIAAHQAALNFASLFYMLPMSTAMALTIVVGFEAGAKRFTDAKQYTRIGIIAAVTLAALFAVLLFLFNHKVAGMYFDEPGVRLLTESFLIYAIFFQLSDAVAAPVQGALRGYKDVNAVFLIALMSYWMIGLPVGFVLAKFTSLAAYGYWIGLISGLAAGAVCLFTRLAMMERRYAKTSVAAV